jgi:hypothetical protein
VLTRNRKKFSDWVRTAVHSYHLFVPSLGIPRLVCRLKLPRYFLNIEASRSKTKRDEAGFFALALGDVVSASESSRIRG